MLQDQKERELEIAAQEERKLLEWRSKTNRQREHEGEKEKQALREAFGVSQLISFVHFITLIIIIFFF